jgi:glutamate dehydrogenase/leucine dehydrogenase
VGVLGRMEQGGHEEVVFHHDRRSGLRAIVAIHSTALGPALGGTRWHPYGSEEEALEDVLRLSSAMTAKAAVAGLDLGGGKAVVVGDPQAKPPEQLRAYGALVQGLGGRYITTTDVGTTTREMDVLRGVTRYVVGVSQERGGGGDTSELTSVTVTEGMRAALRFASGDERFEGRHVVVLGVGKVGARVARFAAEHGARVTVADTRADAAAALARALGAEVVDPSEALFLECDILSPNALGNVLNRDTIPRLRCRVVCGGANNQLGADPEDARLLDEHGIVYAPDYVVNCGGLINAAVEWEGYREERARSIAGRVYDTTLAVLEAARRSAASAVEMRSRLVEQRLRAARKAVA